MLIINTGGTISCVSSERGYEPVAGYVTAALQQITALKHRSMPEYVIKEYQPLLDSSNMTPDDWNQMAQDITDAYQHYDGFVIFHGTDTMAYTASALSFMLENLAKPVIITGSQIPLSEVRNDAIDNIITSVWLCAHQPVPEVCIYFNQCLLRGNRSQKISAQQFKAFDSPNYPHLATIGINVKLEYKWCLPWPEKPFNLQRIKPHMIANFRLFPGIKTAIITALLQKPLQGLVLETYGAGNAPNNDHAFLASLKAACNRDIVIVNCTQCSKGGVEMSHYATGHALSTAGLISGYDMTPEAAHCKLLYLFSKDLPVAAIKQQMITNLCGELTQTVSSDQ